MEYGAIDLQQEGKTDSESVMEVEIIADREPISKTYIDCLE